MASKIIVSCLLLSSCLAAPQTFLAREAVGSHSSHTHRSPFGTVSSHSKTVTDGTSHVTRHDTRVNNNGAILRVSQPRFVNSGPFAVQAHPHQTPFLVGGNGATPVITAARDSTNLFQTADGRIFAFSNGQDQIRPGQYFQTPDGRIFTTASVNNQVGDSNNNNNNNAEDNSNDASIVEVAREANNEAAQSPLLEQAEEEEQQEMNNNNNNNQRQAAQQQQQQQQQQQRQQQQIFVTQGPSGLQRFVAATPTIDHASHGHNVFSHTDTPFLRSQVIQAAPTSRFVHQATPQFIHQAAPQFIHQNDPRSQLVHQAAPQFIHQTDPRSQLVHHAVTQPQFVHHAVPQVVRAAGLAPIAAPIGYSLAGDGVSSAYFTYPSSGFAFQY